MSYHLTHSLVLDPKQDTNLCDGLGHHLLCFATVYKPSGHLDKQVAYITGQCGDYLVVQVPLLPLQIIIHHLVACLPVLFTTEFRTKLFFVNICIFNQHRLNIVHMVVLWETRMGRRLKEEKASDHRENPEFGCRPHLEPKLLCSCVAANN